MRKKIKKSDNLDIGLVASRSEMSGFSGQPEDVPIVAPGNDDAGMSEKLHFEQLNEEEEEDIEKETSEL